MPKTVCGCYLQEDQEEERLTATSGRLRVVNELPVQLFDTTTVEDDRPDQSYQSQHNTQSKQPRAKPRSADSGVTDI